jgi:uncharacterized protein
MPSHKKESNTSTGPGKTSTDQSADGIDPDNFIVRVKNFAKTCFDGASGSHDWEHSLRVLQLCELIGPAEKVDMDVLRVAALLHDIGRGFQDASNGAVCHAQKGAQMAGAIVETLPLTKDQKQDIIHCIGSHRFRSRSQPKTPEAQVLFDADKLDAIGAIGVARAFLFAGEVGARLHNPDISAEDAKPYSKDDTGYREFKVKLCKIKNRMLTAEGRKLARGRHAFMAQFFKHFLEEYEGKR